MAYTATVVDKTVFGNKRVHIFDVTADAASGSVDSGMSYIDAIQVSPVSMATFSLVKFRPNINAASAASNGLVMISAAASGDRFFLHVYGK